MFKSSKEIDLLDKIHDIESFLWKAEQIYRNANRSSPIFHKKRKLLGELRDKIDRHAFWRSL